MKQTVRWGLMFIPLVIVFVFIGFLRHDLTHVQQHNYACSLVGTGLQVASLSKGLTPLYSDGSTQEFDIALQCNKLGMVILRDREPFRWYTLQAGIPASLNHRNYQWLPDNWRLSISHSDSKINP